MILLLLVAAAATALLTGTPQDAAAQAAGPASVSSVVLLLAPGTSLSDWRRGADAPDLERLTRSALLGVVPTGPADTSLADACRALAFGTRAPDPNDPPLGETLAGFGVRVTAVAHAADPIDEPVRIVAGAGSAGSVTARAAAAPWRVPLLEAPDGVATGPRQLAGAIRNGLSGPENRPVLVIALFDDLARADRAAPLAQPEAARAQRSAALARLGRLLHDLTSGARAPDVLLVVTPQPSRAARRRGERLGPTLLWRRQKAAGGGGLLTSPSTRRTPGLAANADIAAGVARLLGTPAQAAAIGSGRVLEAASPRGGGAQGAAYLTRRVANWAAQVREQRLLVALPYLLALSLLAGAAAKRARRHETAAAVGLWAAGVPLGLLLAAPFAPVGPDQAWVIYAIALALSLTTGPLLYAATRQRIAAAAPRLLLLIAGLTTVVLALDPWFGAPLLGRTPLSYSVVEAARYYGMGNEAAGVYLGAGIVTAAAFLGPFGARKHAGRLAAFLIGLAVTATLALPRLGADFGGLIAALAGFGTLLFAGALPGTDPRTRRKTLGRAAATASLAALVIAAAVSWDAGRPTAERTHVGQAVARARSAAGQSGDGGGLRPLAEITARKAATAGRLLATSPWSLLLAAEAAAVLLLARRKRTGETATNAPPAGFAAIVAAAGAALLVNDSGVVAAATCLLYGAAAWLTRDENGAAGDLSPAAPF